MLVLARIAEEAQNFAEAGAYFTQVLEIDSRNAEAWIGKGFAAGRLSSLASNRFQEMQVCFERASQVASPDKASLINEEIALKAFFVARQYFSASLEHVLQFVSLDSARDDHTDRVLAILAVCEWANHRHPDYDKIPQFMVDIAQRQLKASNLVPSERKAFAAYVERFKSTTSKATATARSHSLSDWIVPIVGIALIAAAWWLAFKVIQPRTLFGYLGVLVAPLLTLLVLARPVLFIMEKLQRRTERQDGAA